MKSTPLYLLLQRTPLNSSFPEFIKTVEKQFPSIGKIQTATPIMEGYEDANIILETSTGKFVIKIFLTERTQSAINSYVKIFSECPKVNVPTLEMLTDYDKGLGKFISQDATTQYIITKFFDGTNFQYVTPTLEEIELFTTYLAQLNTLSLAVGETYDSWGNKNFAKEFEEKKEDLTTEQFEILEPIYQQFLQIPLSTFSTAFIHGDLQRKHILKNMKGKYCLIDFGCMANSPKVIELSTYLAWFALQEDTWEKREQIYSSVIKTYTKTHTLTNAELKSLPILTRAAYASYYLSTSCLIAKGDKNEETIEWHKTSKKMLQLTADW